MHEVLKRFRWASSNKPQDQPHKHTTPNYGSKVQYATSTGHSPTLSKERKTLIRKIVGCILYYGRAVDASMLPALSTIASDKANPTETTWKKVETCFNYAATHPDAIIAYRASKMILAAHSDASHLSERETRRRTGGHFYLSENQQIPPNNGALHVTSSIIKLVMSSAAEAELEALYINTREAVPMRMLLQEMGHPQPKQQCRPTTPLRLE